MKPDTRPGPQAKYSKHVSPSVGEFAIQECERLRQKVKALQGGLELALTGLEDFGPNDIRSEVKAVLDASKA